MELTEKVSRAHAWALALAGTLAMAISFFDRQTLAVLAPTVTAQLHIDDEQYGLLAAAFSLAYLVGAPFAGRLVDRVGARRGMLGAIVVWTIAAALHAVAPGLGALFALRLALGLAESPSYPAAVQTVQRALGPADRARGMSTLFIGMSLGAMLVPKPAVWLTSHFGWRAAFGVTAGVGLLWIPLWLALTRGARAKALLDAREAERERQDWRAILRHPSVLRALLALVAVTPCSAFAMAWEAKYYVRNFGLHQADLGGLLMVSAFAYDGGALLFGDLAGRWSAPRALFGAATALAFGGMLGLAYAPSVAFAVACMAAGGVGRGALVTLFNSDMAARAPRAHVSTAAGLIASARAAVHFAANRSWATS